MSAAGGSYLPHRTAPHCLFGVLAVNRWPVIALALALSGAVAVVFCPRAADPAEAIAPPACDEFAEGYPETVALRSLAKKFIATETASGRRSLVEAAALFRELNRLPHEFTVLVRPDGFPHLPGRTDAELLCLQVIAIAAATG